MSQRQVVVLGSASQVPTRYRNHNGYLLRWDGLGVMFDPGEGTQRQMTIAGVTASSITHICLTHFHGDHCLGLPGVLQRISLDGVSHPVHVHFPGSGEVYFDRLRRASIYLDKADIRPHPHEAPGVIATTAAFTLHTAPLVHSAPAWGYRIEEPDGWSVDAARADAAGVRGPAIGQLKRDGAVTIDGRTVRIEDVATVRRGQKLAFVMDTRPCDAAVALAADADLLICESTFLDSEAAEAHAYGHMTAADAGRLARDAGCRRLLLTHFSQRYGLEAPFAEQAGRYVDDVVVAKDFLVVDLPDRRGGGAA
ncbi:MAG: ribonuclease Z [Alphaproteobacteria bacterium]|nr:ribonuclease Z [Alphaproteobacteria bacterium]